jgi:polyferredoxin
MPNVTSVIGLVWAVVSIVVIFILLKKKKLNRYIGIGALLISTFLGFFLFSPMIPLQFQDMISNEPIGKGPMLIVPILALIFIILSTAYFGRIFCGYSCPIGAVQELLYKIPLPKFRKGSKWLFMGFRWVFLIAIVISGILTGISLLGLIGVGSFFRIDVGSWPFYVFGFILVISVFIYRPFCRLFCPIGALMSLVALIPGNRYHRNEKCVDCGMCEKACPTDEAGRNDRKMECYVCGRCDEACKFNALDYSRKKGG